MTWFVPDEPAAPKVWHVCFVGKERMSIWDYFLARFYRHAFLLGYLPEHKLWLRYEVLFHRTEISLISPVLAGGLLSVAVREGGCLAWPAGVWQQPSSILRFGWWCVPAIKHVLGLRCVAITPRGLHDWLLQHGAEPLLPEGAHEPVLHTESAAA